MQPHVTAQVRLQPRFTSRERQRCDGRHTRRVVGMVHEGEAVGDEGRLGSREIVVAVVEGGEGVSCEDVLAFLGEEVEFELQGLDVFDDFSDDRGFVGLHGRRSRGMGMG